MTKNELPSDGEKVYFLSASANPHRKKLNDCVCTILSRKELPESSLVYWDYSEHIAVEVKLPYHFDDDRHNGGTTWVDLSEIHVIKN
ncbi:MAG: hypothetical protein PHG25_04045 [Candidatus Pacebacteria bacterium]|nr:hypothetical protein [Candidatus Paceibacterota bacterium]